MWGKYISTVMLVGGKNSRMVEIRNNVQFHVPKTLSLLSKRSWVPPIWRLVQLGEDGLICFLAWIVGKLYSDGLRGPGRLLPIQALDGFFSFNPLVKPDKPHTSWNSCIKAQRNPTITSKHYSNLLPKELDFFPGINKNNRNQSTKKNQIQQLKWIFIRSNITYKALARKQEYKRWEPNGGWNHICL